jgi:hypothetical protein
VVHHLERWVPVDDVSAEHVSLVLQDGVLVSFKEHASDLFEPVMKRLRSEKCDPDDEGHEQNLSLSQQKVFTRQNSRFLHVPGAVTQ